MYKKRKKTRRDANGGINNPIDKDKLNAAIDTLNTFMAKDLGGNFGRLHQGHSDQVQHSLYNKPFEHPINKGNRIDEVPRLIESMKKLEGEYGSEGYNPGVPDVDINALVRNIKYLESLGDAGKPYLDSESISLPERKEHGGMVDDSNQPDSLTNYIKGHDMKKNKKYRMGGMPNDDKFTRQDSINVYGYRDLSNMLGEDAARSLERRGLDMKNPDAFKNLLKDKELSDKMGDLGDFKPTIEEMRLNKKYGGMVKKSKGGHRDPFTQQYD